MRMSTGSGIPLMEVRRFPPDPLRGFCRTNTRHTREGGYPVRRGFSALSEVSGILDHPLSRMMTAVDYFRTQITRTTAAFASADPAEAVTPLPLRNSRTVSPGTSTACAAGVAVAGPATIADFNSAMPANLPSPSSAAAPEKPSAGGGDNATSPPPPICDALALTLLTAAGAPRLCGSAMPVRATADFAAPSLNESGFNPRAP